MYTSEECWQSLQFFVGLLARENFFHAIRHSKTILIPSSISNITFEIKSVSSNFAALAIFIFNPLTGINGLFNEELVRKKDFILIIKKKTNNSYTKSLCGLLINLIDNCEAGEQVICQILIAWLNQKRPVFSLKEESYKVPNLHLTYKHIKLMKTLTRLASLIAKNREIYVKQHIAWHLIKFAHLNFSEIARYSATTVDMLDLMPMHIEFNSTLIFALSEVLFDPLSRLKILTLVNVRLRIVDEEHLGNTNACNACVVSDFKLLADAINQSQLEELDLSGSTALIDYLLHEGFKPSSTPHFHTLRLRNWDRRPMYDGVYRTREALEVSTYLAEVLTEEQMQRLDVANSFSLALCLIELKQPIQELRLTRINVQQIELLHNALTTHCPLTLFSVEVRSWRDDPNSDDNRLEEEVKAQADSYVDKIIELIERRISQNNYEPSLYTRLHNLLFFDQTSVATLLDEAAVSSNPCCSSDVPFMLA